LEIRTLIKETLDALASDVKGDVFSRKGNKWNTIFSAERHRKDRCWER